jgi:CheY-like chemotaxis protein
MHIYKVPGNPPRASQDIQELSNVSVLVVDDDQDTRDLLREVLERSGATVVTKDSIESAIHEFRTNPSHAIVADIRIGQSDGYTLLKAVRAINDEYRGNTAVIAVTGYASEDDRKRALSSGFSAYLPKPFDPDDVVDAVARSLASLLDMAA